MGLNLGNNLRMQSLNLKATKTMLLSSVLATCLFISPLASAEVLNIPVKRAVPTQPVTTLEIVAIVKSLLSGRVLSIKKQASYSNPDCHHVKLLEDKGEFQLIKLGCYIDNIAQTDSK